MTAETPVISADRPVVKKVKNLSVGAAGTIGATGGLGGALMGLSNIFIQDENVRAQLSLIIPLVAVSLAELCKYIWSLQRLDPDKYRLRKNINKKIKLLENWTLD